jgi:hypothetical protein
MIDIRVIISRQLVAKKILKKISADLTILLHPKQAP